MDGWMISGQDTVLCWVPVPYLTTVVHIWFQSDSGSGLVWVAQKWTRTGSETRISFEESFTGPLEGVQPENK